MRKAPGSTRLCASLPLLLASFIVSAHVRAVKSQCSNISYTVTPHVHANIEMLAPDGSSNFFFFATPVSWCTAEASCRDHGGHLASLLTSDENKLVLDTCFNKLVSDPMGGCWIGLNDLAAEGNYTWTDGSVFYYQDWYSGPGFNQQPDDAVQPEAEDCVFAFKTYPGWHDRDCTVPYAYVCRVPVTSNTTQTSAYPKAAETTATPAAGASTNPSSQQQPSNIATPPPAAAPAATPAAPAPAPPPPSGGGPDFKVIAATVAPILTGVAALVAIAYTGWKWWHKRQATLARKKLPALTGNLTGKQTHWGVGVNRTGGVKPVDAV